MDSALRILLVLGAAYLLGGIPFALLVGRVFYQVDVRMHGSGNLGATNVFRVLGPKAGAAVLLLDAIKGAAAVLIAHALHPPQMDTVAKDWVLIAAMFAAVVGHSYSPYLRMRGGKGGATAAGALLVLTPQAWPILLATFVVVVVASRIVSLASVVIAIEFPLLVLWLYPDREPFLVFSLLASGLVLWRHRENIVRIFKGEEAKISIGRRRQPSEKEDGE